MLIDLETKQMWPYRLAFGKYFVSKFVLPKSMISSVCLMNESITSKIFMIHVG